MTIAAGDYEGKAIEGKVQFGEAGNNGSLCLYIDMEIFNGPKSIGQMTTLLYFTEGAAIYAYERLRLLGWKGKSAEDLRNLGDIYNNRVPVRVTAPEQYKDPVDGAVKMGSSKLEIVTGAGTIKVKKAVDIDTFIARAKALGVGITSGSGSSGGGGAPPPF